MTIEMTGRAAPIPAPASSPFPGSWEKGAEKGAMRSGAARFNALKHGLRAASVLLPGDDAAEFYRWRRELFETYQPLTRDEADCVENMIACKWRIERCRRVQAAFDAALEGLISGAPEGHLCEPDPHRWQHRAMDCVLEEQRLHRLLAKERATLLELQRLRRHRLIDGAITVTASYRDFLGAEPPQEPPPSAEAARETTRGPECAVTPPGPRAVRPAPSPPEPGPGMGESRGERAAVRETPANGSPDWLNGFFNEREVPFPPPPWSAPCPRLPGWSRPTQAHPDEQECAHWVGGGTASGSVHEESTFSPLRQFAAWERGRG